MMVMKTQVENLEDVAEPLREHYKETVDEVKKTKVYVLDTEGSIDVLPPVKTLKTELGARRISERNASTALAAWKPLIDAGVKPEEVNDKLSRIAELELLADGKVDDKKIDKIVEERIKVKVGPIERELTTVKTQLVEKDKVIEVFKTGERNRKIGDAVSKAARDGKVVDTALEDIQMLGERIFEVTDDGTVVTKDGNGFIPGLAPKDWLAEMQQKRPHWWGPTAGGGAPGGKPGAVGGGANPWSHDGWNFSEQSRITATDPARADKLAAAAGTTVGGRKPAKK
jgi:hypothetical protein